MTIRTKLVVFLGTPLVLVYTLAVVLVGEFLSETAQESLRERVVESASASADILDRQLVAISELAAQTARLLEAAPNLSDDALQSYVQETVRSNALVYGSCIAFDPGAMPGRRKFAPYAFRDDGNVALIDIADAYDYPEKDWFASVRDTNTARWTDPYFDEGAGNAVMVTYSAPFSRDGAFAGVATVDVLVEDLKKLVMLPGSKEAIVTNDGRFVVHPEPDRVLKTTVHELAERFDQPGILDLFERARNHGRGVDRQPSVQTGEMNWVAYAPIESTNWFFVESSPESAVLAPIRSAMLRFSLIMLAGLIVIVALILIVTRRMTKPLADLAHSVERVGRGELTLDIPSARLSDEVGALSRTFRAMLADLRAHIESLKEQTRAREAVETELRLARDIQTSLIPRTFPPFPDRDEFALYAENSAAKQVAGDFFDFFLIGDDKLAVIIADVSGKGAPAAMFMAVTRTLLREYGRTGLPPSEALARTSATLAADNDKMLFVTLFYAHYHIKTGELLYCNAGHNPAYFVRASGTIERFPNALGIPVGFDGTTVYQDQRAALEPGDALFLYTDGVVEAHGEDGNMLGDAGLEELLDGAQNETPEALCRRITKYVDEFQKSHLFDDVTTLTLRRTP